MGKRGEEEHSETAQYENWCTKTRHWSNWRENREGHGQETGHTKKK